MKIRRALAAMLALALLICALPAFAVSETMYAVKTSVKVYKTPSTSGAKAGTLSYGDEVTVAVRNTRWAQITYDGEVAGYCLVSQLSANDPSTYDVPVYSRVNEATVYSATSTASDQLGSIVYGEGVRGVGLTPDKAWVRVKWNCGYGFIRASQLSLTQPATSSLVVYVSKNTATLRSRASGSAQKAGTVYFGEEFVLTRVSGSWGYISNGSISGWCPKAALTTVDPAAGSGKIYYAAVEGMKVYVRVNSSLGAIGSIALGAPVTVVAFTADKKFAMIDYNDGRAYVDASQLSLSVPESAPAATPTPIPTPTPEAGAPTAEPTATPEEQEAITVYVTKTSAAAYSAAANTSTRVGTVYFGEALTCTAVSGDWALISNSVGQGWVLKSALSTQNPAGENNTYYTADESVRIFAKPLSSAKVIGSFAAYNSVTVVGTTPDDEWHRVAYDGGYGYVHADDLALTAQEQPVTVYVRYNIAEAYTTSSSSSKKVGEVCYGEELTRLRVSGSWALVKNSSGQGWIMLDALTTVNPNTYNTTLYVSQDSTPVYKKPGVASTQLTTYNADFVVTAVAITTDKAWIRVKYKDGYAFIAADRLSATSAGSGELSYTDPYRGTASDTIERVVALAVAQFGKPYVYAEEGPDSFDCTGLTWYAYSNGAKVYLKRTAYEQGYDDRFTRIESIDNLRRGDIVVFNTIDDGEDMSDHTGIYLGGGLFIHSSSGAQRVIVSNLNSGYYNRKFSWALRIID